MDGKSPRALRRTKTAYEFNTVYKRELAKIKSNSEKLTRRKRESREKKTPRLVEDLKRLPRPRSPSLAKAFQETAETVAANGLTATTSNYTEQLAELQERHDLQDSINEAHRISKIGPLLAWDESLWNRSAFKLLFYPGKHLESRLGVYLLVHWLENQGPGSYFREDGGASRMLKFLVSELDSWRPTKKEKKKNDLFSQCIEHCAILPQDLHTILSSLVKRVESLTGEIMFSALMLHVYLPQAKKAEFSLKSIKEAQRQCRDPPDDLKFSLKMVYALFTPSPYKTFD